MPRALATAPHLPAVRAWVACAALAVAACETEHAPLDRGIPPRAAQSGQVLTSELQAGPPVERRAMKNPYEGNVHAVADGKRLYGWMNCAGCHGAIGGGAIGPPLSDRDWIYGGDAGAIYQSIVQGRPNGMPAYRDRLPEDSLWRIVAYLQSLGGTPAREEEGSPASQPERARRAQPQPDTRDVGK